MTSILCQLIRYWHFPFVQTSFNFPAFDRPLCAVAKKSFGIWFSLSHWKSFTLGKLAVQYWHSLLQLWKLMLVFSKISNLFYWIQLNDLLYSKDIGFNRKFPNFKSVYDLVSNFIIIFIKVSVSQNLFWNWKR